MSSIKHGCQKFVEHYLKSGPYRTKYGTQTVLNSVYTTIKKLFFLCVYVNVVVIFTYLLIHFLILCAKYIPTFFISTCEHQLLIIMLCKLVHCNPEYDANKLLHVFLNN